MSETPTEILLVEDDDLDAKLIQRFLLRPDALGTAYRLTRAGTLAEARSTLHDGRFALTLLDLNLPDSDWHGTLDTFEAETSTPVVIFTGVDDSEIALMALKRGFQDFLVKGRFDEAGLKRSIRYAIERGAVDAALRAANQELARSNEELQQFAFVASHDLREPLRTMKGFVNLLEKRLGDRLEGKDREMLDFVTDAAARMTRLVDDLLAYSRVHSTEMTLEDTSLETIVDDVRRSLGAALGEVGGTITISGELPTVCAHPGLLRQVFQNLFANSLKFAGERTPEIRVEAHASAGAWTVSVRDNGMGFDPSHAEAIFEPFRREHARSEIPRSGLGLSICRRVLERHGGRIRAESEPGSGATFHLTLPR